MYSTANTMYQNAPAQNANTQQFDPQFLQPPPYPQQNFQQQEPSPSWRRVQTPQQPGVHVVQTSQPQAQRVRVVYVTPPNSYQGHKTFALLVAFFCNPLFGLIAYGLAGSASSNKHSDPDKARHYGRASIAVSVFGILIAVGIVVGIVVAKSSWAYGTSSTTTCTYYRYGVCQY